MATSRTKLIKDFQRELKYFSSLPPNKFIPASMAFSDKDETAADTVEYCKNAIKQLKAGANVDDFDF
jgi:hypothetical protein